MARSSLSKKKPAPQGPAPQDALDQLGQKAKAEIRNGDSASSVADQAYISAEEHYYRAGKILLEAKTHPDMSHGRWLPFLKQHDIVERTAQQHMALASGKATLKQIREAARERMRLSREIAKSAEQTECSADLPVTERVGSQVDRDDKAVIADPVHIPTREEIAAFKVTHLPLVIARPVYVKKESPADMPPIADEASAKQARPPDDLTTKIQQLKQLTFEVWPFFPPYDPENDDPDEDNSPETYNEELDKLVAELTEIQVLVNDSLLLLQQRRVPDIGRVPDTAWGDAIEAGA